MHVVPVGADGILEGTSLAGIEREHLVLKLRLRAGLVQDNVVLVLILVEDPAVLTATDLE